MLILDKNPQKINKRREFPQPEKGIYKKTTIAIMLSNKTEGFSPDVMN